MTRGSEGDVLEQQRRTTGLSLLFAAGTRPPADRIDAVLRGGGEASAGALHGAMVSHRPAETEGWIELLASGLTFELHGLAPAPSLSVTPAAHAFGFDEVPGGLEAVALVAGPHIAGGSAMIPVVRTITGLAANLALSLPVRAVCWEPAGTWMEPGFFARAIIAWLAGGPFPVLGLTALVPDAAGVTSVGLAFFGGQEVRVAAAPGEAMADTARLAIRMVDNIVRRGAIIARTELDGPGVALIAEPSPDGRVVTIWRGR